MRLAVALVTLLAGCGDVIPIVPDAPPIDAAPDAPPDAPPLVPRMYALTATLGGGPGGGAVVYGLEIVDLRTMTLVRRLPLGAGTPTSIVVSPDGKKAYVSDIMNAEIGVYDTTTGVAGTPIPVTQVRDLVMTTDGSRIYASAGSTLVAIATATGTQTPSPSLGSNETTLGIALSPDGQRLATATTNGGTGATITLVRTSDMSIEMAVPVITNVSGCGTFPVSVAFSDSSLLLSWDNNCDQLYQIDPGTHTQLTARSIATGRDSGAGGQPTSRFAVSNSTHLAYAIREDSTLAIMNPATLSFTNQGGFTDTPWAVAASADGSKVYVSVIHQFASAGADTLDVLDTATTAFQRSAYTFMSTTQSVQDMAIVTSL